MTHDTVLCCPDCEDEPPLEHRVGRKYGQLVLRCPGCGDCTVVANVGAADKHSFPLADVEGGHQS